MIKILPNIIRNLKKAYVEGVYNDSPLNRQLGRVGMSYKEYEKMIGGYKKDGEKERKENNEIPIYLSDLNFNKEGIASYKIGSTNIQIKLVSHEKYGDKKFNLKVGNREYTNLNTTDLLRRMKALKDGMFKESFEGGFISNKIPLSAEEFDKLYGDIGFNYTYYKDNLDIKVWIREDSDKKNPTFNIYVKDKDTHKTKSFTKLTLLETHNKLLEYDLNPDIEKPLSIAQLKEFKRIQKEKHILKEDDDFEGIDENKDKDLIRLVNDAFDKDGKLKYGHHSFKVNGLEIGFYNNRGPSGTVSGYISDIDLPIKYKTFSIKSNKKELINILKKAKDEGKNMDLNNEDDIKPSKSIGIYFNSDGYAFFENNEDKNIIKVSNDNPSKLYLLNYKNNSLNDLKIIDLNDEKDESFIKNNVKNNKKNQVTYINKYGLSNSKPIKEFLKDDKNVDKVVLSYISDMTNSPRYQITEEDKDKLRPEMANFQVKYYSRNIYKNIQNLKDTYVFLNSRKFVNWVDDLPNPKNKTKREMYYDMKNLSKKLSPFKSYSDEFGFIMDIDSVKKYIINKYY